MLYSFKGNYPDKLPNYIMLDDGTQTCCCCMTDYEIMRAGYTLVPEPPVVEDGHTLDWVNNNWTIIKNS
jgi:hypothetical protein